MFSSLFKSSTQNIVYYSLFVCQVFNDTIYDPPAKVAPCTEIITKENNNLIIVN